MVIDLNYLAPVSYYLRLAREKDLQVSAGQNYERQSYKSRCEIAGANGAMLLSVPVYKQQPDSRLYRTARINYSEKWQLKHWRSIESAYRKSSFFEFYEDRFKLFYTDARYELLWEYNRDMHQVITKVLGLTNVSDVSDNKLVSVFTTMQKQQVKKYNQVFDDRHDFLSDLSIVDLIFNLGPGAKNYLAGI